VWLGLLRNLEESRLTEIPCKSGAFCYSPALGCNLIATELRSGGPYVTETTLYIPSLAVSDYYFVQ
jgi:hypothetical protein